MISRPTRLDQNGTDSRLPCKISTTSARAGSRPPHMVTKTLSTEPCSHSASFERDGCPSKQRRAPPESIRKPALSPSLIDVPAPSTGCTKTTSITEAALGPSPRRHTQSCRQYQKYRSPGDAQRRCGAFFIRHEANNVSPPTSGLRSN